MMGKSSSTYQVATKGNGSKDATLEEVELDGTKRRAAPSLRDPSQSPAEWRSGGATWIDLRLAAGDQLVKVVMDC